MSSESLLQRFALLLWALAVSVFALAQAWAAPAVQRPDLRTGPGGSEAMLSQVALADELALGQNIYRHGLGEGGKPITGLRFGGVEAHGATVACVNCHRRSGLGAVEGTDQVSPVAGRFIFTDDPKAVVSMNFRTIKSFNQRHPALTDQDFAAAVARGQHQTGRELSPIMPRFELSAVELRALQAYLRSLSAAWSPGVDARRLRLATVIAPDVSPERRATFLATMRAIVRQKNGNYTPGQRTMSSAAEMMFRSDRFWELDVWELSGPPAGWGAQLDERMRTSPVFALVSGLGRGEWAPVHEFCERQQTPCWFPSVDSVPASAGKDFYSVYFSAGTTLEADVLASHLREQRLPRGKLVQWHRGDAAARMGALRLTEQLRGAQPALKAETREFTAVDRAALAVQLSTALRDLNPADTLVLWWPSDDLPALPAGAAHAGPTFLSARLAGSQMSSLPLPWRAQARFVYPYQAPEQRHASLFYFESWLKTQKMTLSDEVLQAEVFFAMSYLAETLTDMIDNLHRDYLLERAESMLSLREGLKAADETRELTSVRHNKAPGGAQGAMARLAAQPEVRRTPRPMPGVPAQLAVKREGTSIYPRMSLAQGQRFASKGAYLVKLQDDPDRPVVATTDWIVP
jgi:hypothetical protein